MAGCDAHQHTSAGTGPRGTVVPCAQFASHRVQDPRNKRLGGCRVPLPQLWFVVPDTPELDIDLLRERWGALAERHHPAQAGELELMLLYVVDYVVECRQILTPAQLEELRELRYSWLTPSISMAPLASDRYRYYLRLYMRRFFA